MNGDIRVQARRDHIASLSNASALAALEELVWNALDADATEVRVEIAANPLGAVDAVRVADNGTGIDIARAEDTFGGLGGSWKREPGALSPSRRRLHGRHGRGRFKAFAIGGRVAWRTTSADAAGRLVSHILSGDIDEAGVFRVEETTPGAAPGTEVEITGVRASADGLAETSPVVAALAARFALYLKAYPNVRIWFCGLPVTPLLVQRGATSYALRTPAGGEATLNVIEWGRRFTGCGRIVFCGADGFALSEHAAGVRMAAPFAYTAYLSAARFSELDRENMLVMDELSPEVRAYLDAARKTLRAHFRVRAEESADARTAAWIAEGSYPFAADDASPARAAFEKSLADLRAHLDGFDAYPAAERKYLFGLLLKLGGKAES